MGWGICRVSSYLAKSPCPFVPPTRPEAILGRRPSHGMAPASAGVTKGVQG